MTETIRYGAFIDMIFKMCVGVTRIRNVHISKGIYASPPISMVKGGEK
jgi:hypothetical protein